jgi:choline dehydrogenase-like flavoprotein
MSYLNIDAQAQNTYDAIVIGSGISGGWAAKELTGKGLRILVLERGRDVRHVTNYPTTNTQPWEFEHRGQLTNAVRDANPIISKCYAFYEGAGEAVRLDSRLPGWRQVADVGTANAALERL